MTNLLSELLQLYYVDEFKDEVENAQKKSKKKTPAAAPSPPASAPSATAPSEGIYPIVNCTSKELTVSNRFRGRSRGRVTTGEVFEPIDTMERWSSKIWRHDLCPRRPQAPRTPVGLPARVPPTVSSLDIFIEVLILLWLFGLHIIAVLTDPS
ncbi:hypothetical protein B0H14DRAFT_2563263 [Mycena olivaceomarginata]|nr:hypothetical protein B0H14DRAFT_2563263 [Mycena olivaceomarginata]